MTPTLDAASSSDRSRRAPTSHRGWWPHVAEEDLAPASHHDAAAGGPLLAAVDAMGILRTLLGKDTTTDILELLKEQHKEVDELFARIEQGGSDRQVLFIELANKLAAHAAAEEQVFYPSVMSKETSYLLHESVEEHVSIKRVLSDLLALRVDDVSFMARLAVLKEQVTHHAHKEEENKLFPKLRRALTSDERAALGNEFLVLFEGLMQSQPYKNVPDETMAPAQLPSISSR
jgi:hemerythrin superfamily protein